MTFRGGRRSRAPLMPSAQAQHLMQKLVGALAGNAKTQVETAGRTIRDYITGTVIPNILDQVIVLLEAHADQVASPTQLGHILEAGDLVIDADGTPHLADEIPRSTSFESTTDHALIGTTTDAGSVGVVGNGPTGVAGQGDEVGVFGIGDEAGGKFRAAVAAAVGLIVENLSGATADLIQAFTNGVKTWWVDKSGNMTTQGVTVQSYATLHRVAIDDTYTVLATDCIIGVAALAGDIDLYLPAATGQAGRILIIKDEHGEASLNSVTVFADGVEKIDGAASYIIEVDWEALRLYSNGGGWLKW